MKTSSVKINESVREYIRNEVEDWDDEQVATSRFKAFSGQRCDWDPKFQFWRLLLLGISRHLRTLSLCPSEVKNVWFNRGGLTPLCIDQVLFVMYSEGDLVRRCDLFDPCSGRLSRIFSKFRNFGTQVTPDSLLEEDLVVSSLLKEKAEEVVKFLAQCHWSSSCVVTMTKFRDVCGGPDNAYVVLSYLCSLGRACYLSTKKTECIEGVKVSLSSAPLPNTTNLDSDILHLNWTLEKLQQQLDIIDQRYVRSREQALASLKSGDRKVALRRARELKSVSESRDRCTSLFDRVEEVLTVIVNAESTKKVSEAIQIGARAMKENKLSVEEIELCLQELDENIDLQKQVERALESTPSYADINNEDAEEEFRKLELEFGSGDLEVSSSYTNATGEMEGSGSVELLCDALSNIKVTDQPNEALVIKGSEIPEKTNKSENRKLEAA